MEYTINIDEQTLNNLKVFLERINLTGKEVPAYLNVIQALNSAQKEGEE